MRVAASQITPTTPMAVVAVPDALTIALVFSGADIAPIDLLEQSPELILLALAEPPASPSVPTDEAARVRVVRVEDLRLGVPPPVDTDEVRHCFAAVLNPFTKESHVLDAEALVLLVAQGAAIQVTAGLASTLAARELDGDLRRLAEDPQSLL